LLIRKTTMFISEKKNSILKSKKVAKGGILVFSVAFVFSLFASKIATDGTMIDILGNISVFCALLFSLSAVCLLLLKLEAWERDYI
jgi:hypothetical protein